VTHLDSAALRHLHTRYTVLHVTFELDKPFLRKGTLESVCRIKENTRYAEWRVERSYARMNALPPVKYVDIAFTPVGDSLLDCQVTVSRGRLNSISAEVEGTYTAGDWGIAAGLNYSNKNIFRGAEVLTVGSRASYEWRSNGGRAIEAKTA
jgi:outer membrane protein assembly factor BamA